MSETCNREAQRFRLVIVGFDSEMSAARATRFLARVFRERTEAEIAASLEHLPVLIATRLEPSVAETLRRHLQWHGAHVRLSLDGSGVREGSGASSGVATPAGRQASAPAVTTYRLARPGFNDRFCPS